MKFWDTSALVPLFIGGSDSDRMFSLYKDAVTANFAWSFTEVEVGSVFGRLLRMGSLLPTEVASAEKFWIEIASGLQIVTRYDDVKKRAIRLLRVHPLKAADAMQLAAALVVTDENPDAMDFVTLDARLKTCAANEGFHVLP